MYEQTFNFSTRPFTPTPFVKNYFPSESIDQALSQSRSCIDRSSGPVIVIGPTGSGKSLMLQKLHQEFEARFSSVLLDCARLAERQDLLQNILFELQLPYRDMSEGELRLSLIDFLKPSERSPNGVLLLVDDADSLPLELLDEVRLITNLVRNGESRVRLVMAGTQRLEENLMATILDSLNQRIAARCYLQPMNRSETREYIAAHIQRANGNCEQLFTEESLREIHSISEGCPRIVNQLCEHTLALAAQSNITRIEADFVEQAWRDMQNMPGSTFIAPTTTTLDHDAPAAPTPSEKEEKWTVIEFGKLDDDEVAADDSSLENNTPDSDSSPWPEISIEDPIASQDQREETPHAISNELEPYQPADNPSWESDLTITPMNEPASSELQWTETPPESESSDQQDYSSNLSELADFDQLQYSDPKPQHDVSHVEWPTALDAKSDEWKGDSSEYTLEPLASSETVQESHAEDNVDVETHDKVSEPEPTDPSSQVLLSAENENPFAESFESEESVVDRYMPIFVEQNMSSLTVTKDDLEILKPTDAEECGCGDHPCTTSGQVDVEENHSSSATNPTCHVGPSLGDYFPRETDETKYHESDLGSPPESSSFVAQESPAQIKSATDEVHTAHDETVVQPGKRETPITVRGNIDTVSQSEWHDIMQSIEKEQASHLEHNYSASPALPDEAPEEVHDFRQPESVNNQPEMVVDQAFIERRADEVLRSLSGLDDSKEQFGELQIEQIEAESAAEPAPADDLLSELPHSVGPEVTHIALEPMLGNEPPAETWTGDERSRELEAQDELRKRLDSVFNDDQPKQPELTVHSDSQGCNQEDQKVLDELRNQLDSIQYSSNDQPGHVPNPPTELAPSVAIEYSLDSSAQENPTPAGQDDRDMLIVTRSEQRTRPEEPTETETNTDSNPTSTGRAKRMDYQALFDQLRNISDDE